MKVYATLTNPKGNRKGMGSDSRVLVELTYKNEVIGTIGLYPITDEGQDLGYRVVFDDPEIGGPAKVIKEKERISDKIARAIQSFGEQHPRFHSKEMKRWRQEQKGYKQKGKVINCNYVSEDSNICITHDIEH